MSTQHKMYGERVQPSGAQLRKKIQSSRTMKGFRMKPGYLYTVVRAISARVNQNYDGWPSEELKKAHHTFIGKPVFVNHENYNPKEARGVVVASRYVENGNDRYIEVIQEIDAKRFPKLAHEIKTGGLDSVSMGAEAGFTICSACNNKAVDESDMCDHVLYHKGEKLRVRNRKTGKTEEKLVYESCYKLSFFELSYVFDPADETAVASKVIMAGNHRQANNSAGCSFCEDAAHAAAHENRYDQARSQGVAHEEAVTYADKHAASDIPYVLEDMTCEHGRHANLKEVVRNHIWKMAFGEVEAPPSVDTLREEGTAPEDDNDDFHHYVDSPDELSTPNLDAAGQLDRVQEEEQGIDSNGQPETAPEEDPSKFLTLKIPLPQAPNVPGQAPGAPEAAVAPAPAAPMPPPPATAPAGPPVQPQVPMQTFGKISGRELAWMERYFGHRVADWHDAIEANRAFTPEEHADFNREAALLTLENMRSDSTTGRNPVKGTANMARSTLATRGKTASAGRRHIAETDGVPWGREDQGEQEQVFITETAPSEPGGLPDDDESNINNTEGNLVADEEYARALTSKMQRQQAELTRTAQEYARIAGVRKRADEYAGGPTADPVDPTVPVRSAEELTGDDFTEADPGRGVDTSPGGPGGSSLPHESSLQAFAAFDKWLTASTGRSSREHSEKNLKTAAKQFADYNGISVQGMFPALGIVLRQARKVEAAKKAKKGSPMRKRAVDLPAAAPDDRISVPTVTENVTDAEAQASQPKPEGYANNAGDHLADPDQGTGQNWAPGEAPKKSAQRADGILAMRCAEAMIDAGLEPNTRERKYQLAAEFQNMSRGLILDRTALAERFAAVRTAERQKVASGRTRGAALPPGLGSGAPQQRVATTNRQAANDPANDYTLFG